MIYVTILLQNFVLVMGLLQHLQHEDFRDLNFHHDLNKHELLHYFGTNEQAKVPRYHMMALDEKYLPRAKLNKQDSLSKVSALPQINTLNTTNPQPGNNESQELQKPCPNQFNFSLSLSSNATFQFAVKRNEQFLATDFLSFEIRGQHIVPLAYDLDDILGNSEIQPSSSLPQTACFYTGEGKEVLNVKETAGNKSEFGPIYKTSVLATPIKANKTHKNSLDSTKVSQPRQAIVAFDLLDRLNGVIRVGDDEFYVIKPVQRHILKRAKRRKRRHIRSQEINSTNENDFLNLDKIHIIYKWPNENLQREIIRDLGMDPNGQIPLKTLKKKSRKRRNARDQQDEEWNQILEWNTQRSVNSEWTSESTVTPENFASSTSHEIIREKPIFDWDKNVFSNDRTIQKSPIKKELKNDKEDLLNSTISTKIQSDLINTIYDNIRENQGDEYFEQAFYPKTCSVNKYYNDSIDEKDMEFIKNVQTNVMDIDLDIFDTVGKVPIIYTDLNGTVKSNFNPVQQFAKKKKPKIALSKALKDPTNLKGNETASGKSEVNETIAGVIEAQAYARTSTRPVLELAGFLDEALIRLKIVQNRMSIAEIRNQYLSLFHFVHLLYMHPTIGTPININLVRLFVMTQNPAQVPSGNSYIRSLIMQFSHYQYALNGHRIWDNSVLLTGNDLFDLNGAITEKRVIGYGFYGQFVCDPVLSVSLNEGMDGFGSAITITHEMGHNFGMDHDTVASGCDSRKYIMAENLGIGQVTWSSCSARLLRTYINSPAFRCLFQSNNVPQQIPGTGNRVQTRDIEETNIFTNRVYPGILYDVNEQCRSFNGPNSGHDARQNLETICQYVLCTNTISRFYRFPALEGTICSPNMWCRGGVCLLQNHTLDRRLTRKEKGWSSWYLSVPCTSLCLEGGTGIEEFRRTCLSDKNQHNEDCKGDFIYYSTCTALCPKKLTPLSEFIRARCTNGSLFESMFVLNGRGQQKAFDKKNSGKSCRLYCEYNLKGDKGENQPPKYIIRGILPTGTRCNTNPNMFCVKGVCQRVNLGDPFSHKINA